MVLICHYKVLFFHYMVLICYYKVLFCHYRILICFATIGSYFATIGSYFGTIGFYFDAIGPGFNIKVSLLFATTLYIVLRLCVCFVDRCLSFCPFSFGYCVVCSSSIYGFWLTLWYLQTLFGIFCYLLWCSLLFPWFRF